MSFRRYPSSASASANPSVGPSGSTAPTSATLIAGKSGAGNIVPVAVDAGGVPSTNVLSSALPAGASTSALQTAANASLTSIDVKTPPLVGGNQPVTVQAAVVPADISVSGSLTSGTDTVVLGSGGESTSIFEINGTWVGTFIFESSNNNFTTLQPVAAIFLGGLATQSSTFSANGFYSVITAGFQKVRVRFSVYTSGTATVSANASLGNRISVALQGNPNNLQTMASQGAAGAIAWKVDGSAVTQPVSAAALPLPAGASTAALQTSGNASLTTIATNTPALGQTTMLASSPVTIASNQTPLPATQSGNWTTRTADGAGTLIGSVTQGTQISLNNRTVGRSSIFIFRNDYAGVSVTTAAYTQIAAITSGIINEVEIFDSSGQTMVLALGAAAAEVNTVYIFPGGNGRIPLFIPSGSRISVRAISANATVGELDINFYS